MNSLLTGRQKELGILKDTLMSNQAEFIAVYGRRRVDKTYLIKQFFEGQDVIFYEQTGLHAGSLKEQLAIFSQSLSNAFYQGAKRQFPQAGWMR